MLKLRKIWTVVVGAWAAAFFASLVLHGALGIDRGVWTGVGLTVAAAFGGLLFLEDARALKPMPPKERRDAILGWGTLIGAVGAVACLLVPLPWGAAAAVALIATTFVVLRRVPGSD